MGFVCRTFSRCLELGTLNLEVVNTFGSLITDFFCSCDAVEEDYTAYDRLARKLGFKYVMSCLPVGSLVWAQSTGYCRYIFAILVNI